VVVVEVMLVDLVVVDIKAEQEDLHIQMVPELLI
jgi:hypothetical protein